MFLTQTVFFLQSLSAAGLMLMYCGGFIHTIQIRVSVGSVIHFN